MNVRLIRAALAQNLRDHENQYRADDYNPDKIQPPQLFVGAYTAERVTMGQWMLQVSVWAVPAPTWGRAWQKWLDDNAIPIVTAIESDQTLDGNAESAKVLSFDGPLPVPPHPVDGIEFVVQVVT